MTLTLYDILNDEKLPDDVKAEILSIRARLPMDLQDIAIMALLSELPLGDGVDSYVGSMSETGREAAKSIALLGLPWLRYYLQPEMSSEWDGAAFHREFIRRKLRMKNKKDPTDDEVNQLFNKSPFATAPGMPWQPGGVDVVIFPDRKEIMNYLSTWWTSMQSKLRGEHGMTALPNEQRVVSFWAVLFAWGPLWSTAYSEKFDELISALAERLFAMPLLKVYLELEPPDLYQLIHILDVVDHVSSSNARIRLDEFFGVETDPEMLENPSDLYDEEVFDRNDDETHVDVYALLKQAYKDPSDEFYAWLEVDKDENGMTIHIRGEGDELQTIMAIAREIGARDTDFTL